MMFKCRFCEAKAKQEKKSKMTKHLYVCGEGKRGLLQESTPTEDLAHQEQKSNCTEPERIKNKSRLRKLLLAEESKESNTKTELEKQTYPEVSTGKSTFPID